MADAPESDKKKPAPDLSGRTSWLGKIDAGIRAAANFVTFGYADKLDALMSSGSYRDNMERNEAINKFDREHNLAAVRTGQVGITAVAAAPGLVKAAIGKTVQVGGNVLARVTGRQAVAAEAAAARTAASTTAAATATTTTATATTGAAATAAKAATAEGATLAGRAAQAVKTAVKNPGKTTVAATKTVVKAALGLGVPLAVADTLIESATEPAGRDKKETVAEITAADAATVEGGASAVASAITLASAFPGIRAVAERAGEHLLDRMGGRFRPAIHLLEQLAGKAPQGLKDGLSNGMHYVGDLAHSGATTMAKGLGLFYVGGEVAASAYTSADGSKEPSKLMLAADAVRESYVDLKRAGLDRTASGSVGGVAIGAGTVLVTELIEGMVPGIAHITAKERELLQARDIDFGNPQMVKLLGMHMGSELAEINRDMKMRQGALDAKFLPQLQAPGMPKSQEEWQAMAAGLSDTELKAHPFYQYDIARMELEQQQRSRMAALDERWKPTQDRLDAYLASGKADLGNPVIAALAAGRMQDQLAAAERRYQSGVFSEGTLDYRAGTFEFEDPARLADMRQTRSAEIESLQAKWGGVEQRLAALHKPASPVPEAAPEVRHAEAVPVPETPAPAKPVVTAKPAKVAPVQQQAKAAAAPKVAAASPAPAAPVAVAQASPQEAFNERAAVPAAPDSAMTVTVAGLAPEQVTLPPLVGPEGDHAAVDMSALLAGLETGGAPDLPEPQDNKPSQIMALNMRGNSLPTSNMG